MTRKSPPVERVEHIMGEGTSRRISELVQRALRLFLFIFLGSVLVLCVLMQVPYEKPKRGTSIFRRWLFAYKQEVFAEIVSYSGEPYALLQWIAVIVKYALFLIVMFWREASICVIAYLLFPQAKAVLYTCTPDWVDEWGSRMVATFSGDEFDPPPELEGDCKSAQEYWGGRSIGSSSDMRRSTSDSGGDGSASRSPFRGSSDKMRLYNGHEVDPDDWYVFDPVYGVIPITCRDLWSRQSREMEVRREAAIDRGRHRFVPPVRFSGS